LQAPYLDELTLNQYVQNHFILSDKASRFPEARNTRTKIIIGKNNKMATNNFRPLRAVMNAYGRNLTTSDLAKTSSARNYGKYFTRVVLPTAGANPARNFSTNLGVRRMSETRQNSIPLIAQPTMSASFRVLPADHLATNGIARYKVLRQIGSGNFAVVKEAVDRKTGNRVAIKIMNKKQCGKAICQNEVHVLTQLNKRVKHQRVTPVLDVFEDQENLHCPGIIKGW
jgi:hypothetical protein